MLFEPTSGKGSGLVTGTGVLKVIDGLGAAKKYRYCLAGQQWRADRPEIANHRED